jgi:hypothetical protein
MMKPWRDVIIKYEFMNNQNMNNQNILPEAIQREIQRADVLNVEMMSLSTRFAVPRLGGSPTAWGEQLFHLVTVTRETIAQRQLELDQVVAGINLAIMEHMYTQTMANKPPDLPVDQWDPHITFDLYEDKIGLTCNQLRDLIDSTRPIVEDLQQIGNNQQL